MRRPVFAVGRVVVLALSLVYAGAGCGSGNSAASEFVADLCELYSPCCVAAGLRSDGAQCRAFYGAFASASSYDPAAGEVCLTAVRAASSQPDFCSGNVPAVCERAFPSSGTKTPGQTCNQDNDCAPSNQGEVICGSAFLPGGGEIRKCQILLPGTTGSTPCVRTAEGSFWSSSFSGDDVPSTGYVCNISDGVRCDGSTATCVALTPVGGACVSSQQCVRVATCSFVSDTCVVRGAVGATCTSDDECVATAFCTDPGDRCAARSAEGATCSDENQCISDSCVNQKCAAAAPNNFALAFLCGAS